MDRRRVITDIEKRRKAIPISKAKLARQAGVNTATYFRALKDPDTAREDTILKIRRAIVENEKAVRPRPAA